MSQRTTLLMGLILAAILFAFVAFFSGTDPAFSSAPAEQEDRERVQAPKVDAEFGSELETASFGMG